ncbi:MAG: hypothetical protein H0V82_06540 [Candidatus Protochlamydia sp.]|nr:hypothetical protein [Candidatus Protochlamydia sp.]
MGPSILNGNSNENTITRLEQEKIQLQSEHDEKLNQLTEARGRISELETNRVGLSSPEVQRLIQSKKEESDRNIQALKDTFKAKEKELEQRINAAEAGYTANKSKLIASENELNNLNNQINNLKQSDVVNRQAHEDRCDNLRNEIQKLQNEAKELKEKLLAGKPEELKLVQDAQKQIDQLNIDKAELERKNALIEQNERDLNSSIANQKTQQDILTNDLKLLENEKKSVEAKLEELLKERSEDKQIWAKEKEELEKIQRDLANEKQNEEIKNLDLINQINVLNSQKISYESEKVGQGLNSISTSNQTFIDHEKANLKDENNQLQQNNLHLLSEKEKLENEIKRLNNISQDVLPIKDNEIDDQVLIQRGGSINDSRGGLRGGLRGGRGAPVKVLKPTNNSSTSTTTTTTTITTNNNTISNNNSPKQPQMDMQTELKLKLEKKNNSQQNHSTSAPEIKPQIQEMPLRQNNNSNDNHNVINSNNQSPNKTNNQSSNEFIDSFDEDINSVQSNGFINPEEIKKMKEKLKQKAVEVLSLPKDQLTIKDAKDFDTWEKHPLSGFIPAQKALERVKKIICELGTMKDGWNFEDCEWTDSSLNMGLENQVKHNDIDEVIQYYEFYKGKLCDLLGIDGETREKNRIINDAHLEKRIAEEKQKFQENKKDLLEDIQIKNNFYLFDLKLPKYSFKYSEIITNLKLNDRYKMVDDFINEKQMIEDQINSLEKQSENPYDKEVYDRVKSVVKALNSSL